MQRLAKPWSRKRSAGSNPALSVCPDCGQPVGSDNYIHISARKFFAQDRGWSVAHAECPRIATREPSAEADATGTRCGTKGDAINQTKSVSKGKDNA